MNESDGYATQLAEQLADSHIDLTPAIQDKLCAYLGLLDKWNVSFNLTSIPALRRVTELLLDALVALPCIRGGPILDVGSGAGVPALPLAMALPQYHFTLLDSNGKKTRFINQVVIDLQIPNVDVVQSRVEQSPAGFAMITARAFADLQRFTRQTAHLLAAKGEWLAWKGGHLADELARLPDDVIHVETIPVILPGSQVERYLVRLKRDKNIG